MNRITNEDVKRLVRLAEGPFLSTLIDADLIDANARTLGYALDAYCVQLESGRAGGEAGEKFARVALAWAAFIERGEYVKWGRACCGPIRDMEDETLDALLFHAPTNPERMH